MIYFRSISLLFISFIFVFFVSAYSLFAEEKEDVGLITEISGKVSYSSGDAKADMSEAMVFMKVRKNDRLKVAGNSSLTLLFQTNGLREVWKGPLEIRVGEESSTVTEGQASASATKTENLPVMVSDKVFMASELDKSGRMGKSGIRVVRSGTDTPESRLKDGLERYQKMKAVYGEKDIIPDLYLLTLYNELGKPDEMERHLSEMKRKWPGNPELKRLAESVRKK